jgi:predicted nucleic acid-binding protein
VPTVSNSSPLIALAAIGQLDLLPALFGPIAIPDAVGVEIKPSIPLSPEWLQLRPLSGPIAAAVVRPSLGAGEREAISLGLELRAERVILDDRPARRAAQSLGLNVIGVLGILLRAKRHALLPSIRPSLDALIADAFFISPRLYDELLDMAGERDA